MKSRIFLIVVVLALVAALVAAQRRPISAPASGEAILYLMADSERELTRLPARFTRLSDSDEINAGNSMADSYLGSERKPLSKDDQLIENYVQRVGAKLVPYAERKLPYKFHYLPDRSFINAFALPGGHVFIGAGLIDKMDTEDELADVLGHEMEHIDHYHCAERLQTESALRKVPLGGLLGIPVEIFQMGYSKDQELEADREGVLLARKAGYSANGAVRMFETFDKLFHQVEEPAKSPEEELTGVAIDVLTGYFRSHPLPKERIAQIQRMIAQDPALGTPEQRGLEVRYIFLAWQAADKIVEEKFDKAEELAKHSLELKQDCIPALQALAEAELALDKMAAAKEAYKKLLAQDASAAGPVESFAEARAKEVLTQKKFDREISVAQTLLELAPSEPRWLRLLALGQAGIGDAAAASATAEKLLQLYPTEAAEFAVETADRAGKFLDDNAFAAAAAAAKLSMALAKGETQMATRYAALRTLGAAEFAQAQFAEAAATYRAALESDVNDVAVLEETADALASANPASAERELKDAIKGAESLKVPDSAVRTELAGAALIGGDETPALELARAAQTGDVAPESLARLGWWYFRSRRMNEAASLLHAALKLRPDDQEIQNNLAWVELEENNSMLEFMHIDQQPYAAVENAPEIGAAIARWELQRPDDALREWPNLTMAHPQWLNARWREAIYPSHVSETVAAMQAEQERREQARLRRR